MKKYARIYAPDGSHKQYSTEDLGDSYVSIVQEIRMLNAQSIQIVEPDGTIATYCGFPFQFEEWDY